MPEKGRIKRLVQKTKAAYNAWRVDPSEIVAGKYTSLIQRGAAYHAGKKEVSNRYLRIFELITQRFGHVAQIIYQDAGRPYWKFPGFFEYVKNPHFEKEVDEFAKRVARLLKRRKKEIIRRAEKAGYSEEENKEVYRHLEVEATSLVARRFGISPEKVPRLVGALRGMDNASIDYNHAMDVISKRIYKKEAVWKEGDAPEFRGFATHYRNLSQAIGGPYRARWFYFFYLIVSSKMFVYFTKLSEGQTLEDANAQMSSMYRMGTKLAAKRIKKAF